jgi:hypothetical protein
MTDWALLGAAAALWAVAALVALTTDRTAERIGATLSGAGGILTLIAGVKLLLMTSTAMSKTLGGNDIVGVF